ncbi:MAG: hypothetical protein J6S09_06670 [Paludibacteraceae bacterium]|nr:hypothetical protein [Paludibacteraceae bacterium]
MCICKKSSTFAPEIKSCPLSIGSRFPDSRCQK